MNFVEIENYEESPTPEKCEIGPANHKWVLSIEMGSVQVNLAPGEICPPAYPDAPQDVKSPRVCEEDVFAYAGNDILQMNSIPVTLCFEADHENIGGWHFDTPCDCGWWWQICPEIQLQKDNNDTA